MRLLTEDPQRAESEETSKLYKRHKLLASKPCVGGSGKQKHTRAAVASHLWAAAVLCELRNNGALIPAAKQGLGFESS